MKKTHLLSAACACATLSLPVHAADRYWSCNDDTWDASCWSSTSGGSAGAGQPVAGDDVYLFQSDSVNRAITYQNAINPLDELNSLNVDATGTGTVTFSQSQDTLETTQTIIGDAGRGIYDLSGGTHNTNQLILGNQSGSYGELTVGGSATLGVKSTQLVIGNYGEGVFNVNDGATFIPNGFWSIIGAESGSSGTVTISGANATYSPTNLAIGNLGGAVVNVLNGGTLGTGSDDFTKVGYLSGSTGLVTISGTDSNWYHGGSALDVGYQGDGTVQVLAGGELRAPALNIGELTGSNGDVTVSGTGSSILANAINVGKGGAGILNVLNGATLLNAGGTDTNTRLSIATSAESTGVVYFDNTTATFASLNSIGRYGNGELHVSGGSIIDITTSTTPTIVGSRTGSVGLVEISGAGTQLSHAGRIEVGWLGEGTLLVVGGSSLNTKYLEVGTVGTGVVQINSGSTVSTQGFSTIAAYDAQANGNVVVNGSGSSLTIDEFLGVGGHDTAAGGTGVLDIENNGVVTVNGNLTVWNSGSVNLNGGDLTVTGTYTTSGDTVVNGNLSANAVEVLDGKVTGNGTIIADLMNKGGQVKPGNSPGTLTIDGSYSQEVGAELIIEIAGLNPGEFDVLNILGSATFDPGTTIDLSFIGGFAPSTDDVFDFLLAETFASDMSLVNFTTSGLEAGFQFDVDFSDSGTFGMTALNNGVSAVPVPAAVWLFGSGFLVLIGMSRRKAAQTIH